MISGSREYQSEQSLRLLQRRLEKDDRVRVTASWVHDGATDLPEVDRIAEADLLIVFARRLELPEAQMAIVRGHWESGKPVVGIRTASHAFGKEDNAIFDRQVLGGAYEGHFGSAPVHVQVASEKAALHPVLHDVGSITSDKLYKAGPLADDALLLQTGTIEVERQSHSVTWLHEYRGARIFYTSLGVPADFRNESFLRMLVNAVFWTTRQDAADWALQP